MRDVTRLLWAAAFWAWHGLSAAQTIADYSRSQRAVIEAEIARNNAKVLGAAVPPPVPSPPPLPALSSSPPFPASAVALPSGAALPPMTREARPPARGGPEWEVTGVFVSASRSVAEVVVDGSPFFLGVGEPVPGTRWRIDSISAGRVVLVAPGLKAGRAVHFRQARAAAQGAWR